MTRYATIVATGRYVPEIEVTNDMLRERFKHIPEFVDKMEASSGIKTRWPYSARGSGPISALSFQEIASAFFLRTGLNMSMPFAPRENPALSSSRSGRAAQPANCTRYWRTASRAASCTRNGTRHS